MALVARDHGDSGDRPRVGAERGTEPGLIDDPIVTQVEYLLHLADALDGARADQHRLWRLCERD